MSYEPSHRKPPRQERWPSATPGEGWPAHQNSDRPRESTDAFSGSGNGYASYGAPGHGNGGGWGGQGPVAGAYGDPWGGHGSAADTYGDVWGGHRTAAGYGDPPGGHRAAAGYGDPWGGQGLAAGHGDGFDGAMDSFDGAMDSFVGWDGQAEPGPEFAGSSGYPAPEEYPALDSGSSPVLIAPDTIGDWRHQPDHGDSPGRDLGGRGPVVGAVSGLLAAAVTIGVATLAAAFVRPQASPVSAVGGVLTDRLPAAVRSAALAHLGAHGQTLLLLGVIGLAAVALGGTARRNASIGVAGIAIFGLLGAFVAVTRPESRASDVLPSAIGAAAGIVALLWLLRASAPAGPVRPAYGGGRRRAR